MRLPILVLLLAAGPSLAMAVATVRRPGRSGWTDADWSLVVRLAGLIAALVPIRGEAAQAPRRLLVATLVLLWSLRLGGDIACRAAKVVKLLVHVSGRPPLEACLWRARRVALVPYGRSVPAFSQTLVATRKERPRCA